MNRVRNEISDVKISDVDEDMDLGALSTANNNGVGVASGSGLGVGSGSWVASGSTGSSVGDLEDASRASEFGTHVEGMRLTLKVRKISLIRLKIYKELV